VNSHPTMTLPFDLPAISRGHAELEPGVRALGSAAAEAAARAMGEVLGVPVRLHGRARPAAASIGSAVARLPIELAALPGSAWLEVEAALVARIVDRVAGGTGAIPGATTLTPLEASALELLVLAAIDGSAAVPEVEDRLAPRLVRDAVAPSSSLLIDVEVTAGDIHGRAWLLVPPSAVRALAGPPELAEPLRSMPVFASLRGGSAPLQPEELAALAPGDVVLLDPPPEGRHRLVFPGGFTATGLVGEGTLAVEATSMDVPLAQIPILLEVELARVPLTLADLARLVPGATLPLPVDRRGLVTLRLGERAVARGELVDVDGAVGLRVLSVEAP
jgi:type III secretion protein Q